MGRIILQMAALFLLPTVLYLLYYSWAKRKAAAGERDPLHLYDGPWFWLVAVGFGLVLAFFVWLGLDKAPPGSEYVPPSFEDGEIKPAETIPPRE
jgi:hypothetical protein